MNEHTKLKAICDLIKYEIPAPEYDIQKYFGVDENYLDVREIIFTQEFMDKFEANCFNLSGKYWQTALLENLDDPVSYLHNLLLGNK